MEAYFEINNDEIIDLIDDDFARLDTVDQIGCRVDDLEASADDLYQKANELSKKVNTQLSSLHRGHMLINSLTTYQGAKILREMRRARIHSGSPIRRLL
tara:strand:- start:38 stop:334 length:297 start_codon:yes stop_codon:yes gene_type:complete